MDLIGRSTNDSRFEVILGALDRHEELMNQLNEVDRINSVINDEYLTNLMNNTLDMKVNLSNPMFRGYSYQSLLEQGKDIDAILGLLSRLGDCLHDSTRFNEATSLLKQVDLLYKEHGTQVPLLETIHQQAEVQRRNLIGNLCSRLENLSDLPRDDVMQLINNLIDCGNFSARDLKLKYLQARDNWFNSVCKQQGTSFNKLVSVYSGALIMIYEEYRSIFRDSCELLDRNHLASSVDDSIKEDGAIINSWLLLKTSIFIASLEAYLKTFEQTGLLTPSAFADTMKKCFDLANRLSSIGFDFSDQLSPLFHKTLAEELRLSIEKATTYFESSFATIASKSIESLLLPIEHEILRVANNRPEERLPKSIEHYPIFRIYCLQIIESLRWLQISKNIISPINVCVETYTALNASLTRVMKALAIILNTDNNSSHPILSKIAISFLTEVLPFITNYCDILLPEKILLSILGLSKAEFKQMHVSEPEKTRNLRLDLRSIGDPLRSTMPALMRTIEN